MAINVISNPGAIAALLVLCALPHSIQAAPPTEPGRHEVTFTSSWDATTQPYQLYIPKAAAQKKGGKAGPLPLVVVLHGRGVDHHAWFNLTPILKKAEERGWIVAAPYARGNVWYRAAAERDVLDVTAQVAANLPVDPSRIYLAGHSMGGWGTSWIGLRNPQVFAAMASMSGWAPADLLPNARLVPALYIHDEHDPIVPVANSRSAVAELSRLGISHQYREESGYGHGSGLIGDNFDRMFDWFDAHPRQRHPNRFAVASRGGTGLTGEVRVIDSPEPWRAAVVDVDRTETDTQTLTVTNATRFALAPNDQPTTTILNGAFIPTPAHDEWIVFLEKYGAWSIDESGALPDSNPFESQPMRWKTDATATTEPVRIQQRVADILRQSTDADLCLMNSDWLVEPDLPLTPARVANIFVFPDERLAVVEANGDQITQTLAGMKSSPLRIPELFPTDTTLTSETRYSMVMPAAMAGDFKTSDVKILDRPIAAFLLDAIESGDEITSQSAARQLEPSPHLVLQRLMPLTHSRPRATTASVDTIMLHFSSDLIAGPGNPFDVESIIAIYQRYGVSAHYLIDRQGNVRQLVDESREAFHAGKGTAPSGEPRTNRMNGYSIGIEMLAVGDVDDMKPFMTAEKYADYLKFVPHNVGYTPLQYGALRALIADIRTRHPAIALDRAHIIGHEDYAPGRKTDPGALFDWSKIDLPRKPNA
jgi:N-acetyl-anhydromuramyl-L-alanine amidase AmpD/predicted esterase